MQNSDLDICCRGRGIALGLVQTVGERCRCLLGLQLGLQDFLAPPLRLALLRFQPSLP